MKKLLIILLVLVLLLLVSGFMVLPMLGLSAEDLESNVTVGTGMGAKLACSARYVTGLDEQQVVEDLSSYTPATGLLSIDYDTADRSATASLLGFSATTARYRDGLGCTLDIGDTEALDQLTVPSLPPGTGPWPAGEADNPILGNVQTRLEQIMAADNEAGLQTRALAVAHGGRLVAEAYAEGFDAATPLLGWSMGKSLTAIMLGRLELLGRLSVNESGLFDAWQNDERRLISVEDLLHMSSGLDFSEVYAPGSDATAMLFTAHSASDVAIASPPVYPPGTHFSYSSGTANMLARLLTARVGGSQAAIDLLYQDLFRPLGMRHTTFEVDPSGVFVGSSYLYASARDWARLGQLMLNGGELNGQRLVSREWVDRARSPNSSSNDKRYGYQFWLNDGGEQLRWAALPRDAYAMNGNRAQTVLIVPSADAVLVRLGWTSGRYPMAANFSSVLEVLSDY